MVKSIRDRIKELAVITLEKWNNPDALIGGTCEYCLDAIERNSRSFYSMRKRAFDCNICYLGNCICDTTRSNSIYSKIIDHIDEKDDNALISDIMDTSAYKLGIMGLNELAENGELSYKTEALIEKYLEDD